MSTGSSWLAVRNQPLSYQARVRMMVGQGLLEQQPSEGEFVLGKYLTLSYSEIARGRLVREGTQAALGLSWLPQYTVKPVAETHLLDIVVVDSDPERGAAVANELAHQLILQSPTNPSSYEEQRRQFTAKQLDRLEENIETTQDEIDRQKEALTKMFSARQIADTQTQISALNQKLNGYQLTYGQLMTSTGKGAVNSLSVVEPATPAEGPSGRSKLWTVLTAAAIGLVLAVGGALLLEYLDDTIKTPDDVDRTLQLTVLGGISRIAGKATDKKLVAAAQPNSPISEAYRVLRTNLQFSSLDKPLRTLLVTSPNPAEGKSTTVANLAVVMAQAGKQVIIVDADLRRPVLHRIFRTPNNRGLTNVLLNAELNLDGHLQHTEVENLRLLSTGPLPPNPSELLGSQRMVALIERLGQEADVILFDSPPLMAVADASVLSAQTDGVLLVIDAGGTRRNLARESVKRTRQVGANVLGVVLNQLHAKGDGYYYYPYYYYSDDQQHKGRRGSRRGLLGRSDHKQYGQA